MDRKQDYEMRDGCRRMVPIQHGVTCTKVPHDPEIAATSDGGYRHDDADDGPYYDVDGWTYCGRCHRAITL